MYSFPFVNDNTLPGVETRRTPIELALDPKELPEAFPMVLWRQQADRYRRYWSWFNGEVLNETVGQQTGSPTSGVKKYPLQMNLVRTFTRKHAAVLLGEEEADSGQPLVRTRVKPKALVSSKDTGADESPDKELADRAQKILDAVWEDSNGRALQQEQAELTQFLGGSVWEVCWDPAYFAESEIPIRIKSVIPDFFVPVWNSRDPWNLLEAYIAYRIPVHEARSLYGYDGGGTFVTYCEHWTREYHSVFINGQAITVNGTTYLKAPNPFGFVPYVYAPHVREGNFFGSSIVDDIEGIAREYNARMADYGDAIRETVYRRRYARDLTVDPKTKMLAPGTPAINLGNTSVTTKASPTVEVEDPPTLSQGLTNFGSDLWQQANREGSLGPIAFGEDEGSQRSGLTLALRFWPITSHATAERTYWGDAMVVIAKMILKMCVVKASYLKGIEIPKDFGRRLAFTVSWQPKIPRDREQRVSENILLFQAGLRSPELALLNLGDVDYPDEELNRIRAWMQFQSQLQMAAKPQGADTKMETPVATDGMGQDA